MPRGPGWRTGRSQGGLWVLWSVQRCSCGAGRRLRRRMACWLPWSCYAGLGSSLAWLWRTAERARAVAERQAREGRADRVRPDDPVGLSAMAGERRGRRSGPTEGHPSGPARLGVAHVERLCHSDPSIIVIMDFKTINSNKSNNRVSFSPDGTRMMHADASGWAWIGTQEPVPSLTIIGDTPFRKSSIALRLFGLVQRRRQAIGDPGKQRHTGISDARTEPRC